MKTKAIILMTLLCGLLLSGCQSMNSADGDQQLEQQPWNTPVPWENSIIGIPY